MELKLIEKVSQISKEDFLINYFKPQKPVVIERFVEDWPAIKKWNLDYMSKIAGDKIVPLYDDRPVDHTHGFNEPHLKMKLNEYIELIKARPSNYRIFLWNILKEVPVLQEDFSYPDFGLKLLKKVPMLFFGGANSHTFMHYDIDLANIFHFHFEGEKEVLLFEPNQRDFLYKIPYSLITREDIDFLNPDFKKWPALEQASGYTTRLQHGNVLYMPEGYWHYMHYKTPGFSMSLRAMPQNPINFARALSNIFFMRYFDKLMRKLKGQSWIDSKNEKSIVRTHKKLGIS